MDGDPAGRELGFQYPTLELGRGPYSFPFSDLHAKVCRCEIVVSWRWLLH